MVSDIQAFVKKFWELINHDTKNVPTVSEKLSQNPLQPNECRYHEKIVCNLGETFQNHSEDLNKIALLANLVASLFMEIDIQETPIFVMQQKLKYLV
nr:unnamed protein product [Callosobruchus chinensis]